MANNCDFSMRITGGEAEIKELISMLRWEGKFKDSGLGRIYSFYVDEDILPTSLADIYQVDGYGDCAWSVLTAMQYYNGRTPCLESETDRLGLVVELFSSEPGCQFQEHILIAKGVVCIEDCVDYEEHWVDNYDSLEAYNKDNETDFTEDMVDDGCVRIGGFGDSYGCFLEVEDLEEYFSPEFDVERRAALDTVISSCEELSKNNDVKPEKVGDITKER